MSIVHVKTMPPSLHNREIYGGAAAAAVAMASRQQHFLQITIGGGDGRFFWRTLQNCMDLHKISVSTNATL
jgi:hypothetical protein